MGDFRWTEEQARVVVEDGNVLLAASAGTGKTRTIVGKLAWLLGLEVGGDERGQPIPPCPTPCRLDELAAITFTEKAACELKERLRAEVEASPEGARMRWDLDRASVGTIHAFCAGLLRDHALRLGIDPGFRVLDERETTLRLHETIRDQILGAVREARPEVEALFERFGLYDGGYSKGMISVVGSVVREIRWHGDDYEGWLTSDAEGRGLDLRRIADLAEGVLPAGTSADEGDERGLALAGALYELARRSVHAWLLWMEEENVRDFDSLILDVRRLLTSPRHRPALESIRQGLRILIIDEFQDTDGAQRDIAFALAGIDEPDPGPVPQLLLVGDPKQSIYAFRGADVGVWNAVRDRLCGEDGPLELTENFRTQPGLVEFINQVAAQAIETSGERLAALDPAHRIGYSALVPHRQSGPGQAIEWLDCGVDGGNRADREALESRLVVSRIRSLVAKGRVPDEGSPEGSRPVRYSDIAVLGRTKAGLDVVDRALKDAGVATYNAASLGLSRRSEVLDLVTVLRLLADPENDHAALAFLRSPFVGLRDEAITRFRLDPAAPRGSLLLQAEAFRLGVEAGAAAWFGAIEGESIAEVELEASARAFAALSDAQALVDRASCADLLESIIDRTDYRLHLLLRSGADEAIASLERFVALVDEYRHLSVGSFLDLWDRWGEQDAGIPQAALHGAGDDVVTLQTIHTAKGLEWPIVLLIRAGDGERDRLAGTYVADPRLGPSLMPGQKDRGPRATAIAERALAAERAEEARLLYVALTRARDRLIVAAPAVDRGYMTHLMPALAGATPPHLVAEEPARSERKVVPRARTEDPVTRTGKQIEVFPEDETGQLDIFRNLTPEPERLDLEAPGGGIVPIVYRAPDPEQVSIARVPVALSWLRSLVPAELPPLARPVASDARPDLTSATELRLRAVDLERWRLRYRHGVEETWRFAPAEDAGDVPAALRGTLIHGVLERIQAIDELAEILDETIADVGAPPGVEVALGAGTPYRVALEAEIAGVVEGEDWQWYVAGPHHRELEFLVLGGDGTWRKGALDLYRPEGDGWIIDFKTHRIDAGSTAAIAAEYLVQADVYRDAATRLTGRTPRVLLHFTHPGVAEEL